MPIVGGLIAVAGVAAIGIALARIRERRAIRYAAIAGALICAAWYSVATATGLPEVDVVQRFHFVEYGLITFLFYRAWRPLADPSIVMLPARAGLLVGTADEWLQWFIPNRVGELDDIFLNGIAILCGLVFSSARSAAQFRRTLRPGSPAHRPVRRGVRDRAGVFFTRSTSATTSGTRDRRLQVAYSKDRLGAMAAEKVEEWRAHPLPMVLRRVSREEQYASEGVTHVQERNEQLAAGDVGAAWKENRFSRNTTRPCSILRHVSRRDTDGPRVNAQTSSVATGRAEHGRNARQRRQPVSHLCVAAVVLGRRASRLRR